MDLDRKVKRGRERLAQEVKTPAPPPISAEKSEQLSVLEEKIKILLEQVESLGEAGKVDEAEALMRKVWLIFLCLLIHFCFEFCNIVMVVLCQYPDFLTFM